MKARVVTIPAAVPVAQGLANRLRIPILPLLLVILATLTTSRHLLSQAGEVGRFPIGVLSSKGSLHLNGRVDWGQGGRSPLPTIYDGTRIDLKNGSAELELLAGGSIQLCQDADLTIQQHQSPFLFTLQRGSIAFDIPQSQGDVFLTPDFLIKIHPESELKSRHHRGEIRLEPDGTICVGSQEGLLIVTTQDNSKTVTAPAGTGMRISPGQTASPERFQDCSCADTRPRRERGGLRSAVYRADGSAQKGQWKSFLRKLVKILTLGLV